MKVYITKLTCAECLYEMRLHNYDGFVSVSCSNVYCSKYAIQHKPSTVELEPVRDIGKEIAEQNNERFDKDGSYE